MNLIMRKYIIACFITLVLSNYTQAQNEYGYLEGKIVKKEGDTIKCYIQMSPSYGSIIKYKLKSNSAELKIKLEDITFLLTPYNKFEKILYKNQKRLMTVLVNGKVILYSYMEYDEGIEKDYGINGVITTYKELASYIIKKDNVFYEVKHGNFKELLTSQFNDCNDVIMKINKKKYKFKDLENVIIEYNTCK